MRHALEKICDPHISVLNNISILRENWLRRRDIDRAKLYIHPITYDRLMAEISTGTQGYWYVGVNRDTIMGLPIKQDPRVSPYHLLIKEEDNMEIDRDSITIDSDSVDAFRYAVQHLNIGGRGYGKSNKVLTPLPTRYIINEGATILFWSDGTKTIVKRSEDDANDITKSFLWAYFQKHSGMSKTKANKYLAKIVEDNTVDDFKLPWE